VAKNFRVLRGRFSIKNRVSIIEHHHSPFLAQKIFRPWRAF